jgi:soluble lytic murein transglycosylase-like protein
MSLTAVGDRLAAIQQQVAAINGQAQPGSASPDFAAALRSAEATTTPVAASTGTLSAGSPTQYDAQITAAAAKYGLDPALLKGLIRQESNFDPAARSGAGAQGLTQLMPATAASLGVDAGDPAQAIDGGARYLKQQLDRFGGDPSKALAAYNAGPGAVAKFGGVPPYAETQAYVRKVLGYAAEYGATGASAAAAVPSAPTFSAVPPTTQPVAATTVAGASSTGLTYSTL